jgi:hypothetical protein
MTVMPLFPSFYSPQQNLCPRSLGRVISASGDAVAAWGSLGKQEWAGYVNSSVCC